MFSCERQAISMEAKHTIGVKRTTTPILAFAAVAFAAIDILPTCALIEPSLLQDLPAILEKSATSVAGLCDHVEVERSLDFDRPCEFYTAEC